MLAAIINGWELLLLFAVILVLFRAKHLAELPRGLRDLYSHLRSSFERDAHEVGESIGGICGKPGAQALTPDNRTAELYEPAVFQHEERTRRIKRRLRFRRWLRTWRSICRSIAARLKTNE